MKDLVKYLSDFYTAADYPALYAQWQKWRFSRPFAGKKILDATPIFRNTMAKYLPLIAGGAELTISAGDDIPYDSEIICKASEFGIRVADKKILCETFDVVADCAGRHASISSAAGYVELTRSGLEYYKYCSKPVFSVDSGILKRFETTLGTGESFVRAMRHMGFTDFKNRKIVIFGGGKVGCGTAYFSHRAGADTYIIDIHDIIPPEGVSLINTDDRQKIAELISQAWCIVSATGISGALTEYAGLFRTSDALFANMGVEDEFGNALPANRVLNEKRPLNFILDEPTWINCIDPCMALSNAALLLLLEGKVSGGINSPPEPMEMAIIEDMRSGGKMNDEINFILKENKK